MVLQKLFGTKQSEAKTAGENAKTEVFELYPARTPKGLNPNDMGDFGKRIAAFRKAHLSLEDPRQKGSLQILDLETIALRFGKRWMNIKTKAFRHIESVIAKRSGPNDLYVCESEKTILILMTGVERSDAELRGMLIASEITQRLCGVIPGGAAVRFKTLLFDFDIGLEGVTSLNELRKRIKAFNETADAAELNLFKETLSSLQMVYYPTLDTKSGRIYIYHGYAKVRDTNGDLLPTDVVCPHSVNGVFDAEIDKWILQECESHLKLDSAGVNSAMIVVPVGYETLASMKHREAYMAICRRLPAISAEQLVFEINGLPPSLPQARVRELLAYLKPFCNHLIVRISHEVLFIENLTNCSVSTVSITVDQLDEDDSGIQTMLEDLRSTIAPFGMRILITEAYSVKLCHSAFKAGIDQFNGTAFMPAAEKPGGVIDTSAK